MTTVQITLTIQEHGDQDWDDVRDAIAHCTPINGRLKVRDGLSGDIDTYANGFHVEVSVTPNDLERAIAADPALAAALEQAREQLERGEGIRTERGDRRPADET
jgi:hypothetical protein